MTVNGQSIQTAMRVKPETSSELLSMFWLTRTQNPVTVITMKHATIICWSYAVLALPQLKPCRTISLFTSVNHEFNTEN